MEYYELFDAYGQPRHKIKPRHQPLKDGEFIYVVHVWIEDEKGRYLIQKRNKKQDPIPYQWAITSGLPNPKESPFHAALRETKEELGITLDASQLKIKARIVSSHNEYNTITMVYHTDQRVDLNDVKLDSNEVSAVSYVYLHEIKAMIKAHAFWDYPALLNEAQYFDYLERG